MVPRYEETESYEASMPLNVAYISSPMISPILVAIGQQLHPHMDFDQPTLPKWVVDSLCSHDFLDTQLF
jgi:hypothetical protein